MNQNFKNTEKRLSILENSERKHLYGLPKFTNLERKHFFELEKIGFSKINELVKHDILIDEEVEGGNIVGMGLKN